MSASEARYSLQRTLRKYVIIRAAEIMLLSAAVAFGSYALLNLLNIPYAIWLSIVTAIVCFIFQSVRLKIFNLREESLVLYINRHYPEMEESTDLLLMHDEELTLLQQLQKLRKIKTFESLQQSIRLPHHLIQSLGWLVLGVLLFAGANILSNHTDHATAIGEPGEQKSVASRNLPASIRKVTIAIIPPSYTNLPTQHSETFDLKVPEGSTVTWSVDFNNEVRDPRLIFSGRDTLALGEQPGKQFKAQRSFRLSNFYQLAWTNTDGSKKYSNYFPIEVVKDQPPTVTVDNLEQFVQLRMTDNLKVNMQSTVSDDYGLKDAYIIATVSKGSGESVKFREEKLRFLKPSVISGKNIEGSLQLDLLKLGLDPGDELYFYVEALDTKTPAANRTRTETFFISLQDTASMTTSVDPGLGVDLMPEYFRSQRQIIIDSEKLLKERKKISKETFNSRSNDLAHDQKVLRLRYGEFLGEEFDSGIGQAAIPQDDEGHQDEDDIMKKYGHAHDTENEHNLVEEKKSSRTDGHDHHEAGSKAGEDPSKAFLHDHDNPEEETFFTQSIRSKLKAAITIMWDAELHLRMYDPEKSLPFQYKALKLLKEISQDSRIYVHRTGFDPPPLKEEKRLTGDLSEIKNSTASKDASTFVSYPNIRKALAGIDQVLPESTIVISSSLRDIMTKAGSELSAVALDQPGRYLKSLSLLKSLTENELKPEEQRNALLQIRSAFYSVLPKESLSPQSTSATRHRLDQKFLDNLNSLN